MVCVPNGPAKCNECPLAGTAVWHEAEGKISELPKKASKKPRKIEERTVLVIRDGERAAIRKRPSKGLLAGLYELPNLSGSLDADQVLETLKTWGMNALRITETWQCQAYFQSCGMAYDRICHPGGRTGTYRKHRFPFCRTGKNRERISHTGGICCLYRISEYPAGSKKRRIGERIT